MIPKQAGQLLVNEVNSGLGRRGDRNYLPMQKRMSYWREKVVLITGGSAGLGRVLASEFGGAGARIVIASRRTEMLRHVHDELTGRDIETLTVPTDITDPAQVDAMVSRTVEHFGQIHALVNTAGRSSRGRVESTTSEDFRKLLELNFIGLVHCTLAAMPHLLVSKGHVVNIASLAAKVAPPYMGAYAASKFPVAAYSQQLRLEMTQKGLHVLLVCPGPVARPDAGIRYDDVSVDLPDAARKPAGGAPIGPIDPHQLAKQILKSCERRRRELIVPNRMRYFFAAAQLWPGLTDWFLRK